ncbi:MAG: SIMPL domain-containing protein [Anaerolineae bacterium]|jgi:uncharacterized protein YggE
MNRRVCVHLVSVVLLLSGAVLGGLSPGTFAVAQAPTVPGPSSLTRHITVVGQATVSASPDVARANIGVEIAAAQVSDAVSQVSTAMDAVLAALQEAGVAEEDIQTSEYTIFFDPGFAGTDVPAEPTYRVRNMVLVTIRQPERVGEVIQAAITAGANQIFGITFALADTSEVEAQAREMAVADAQRRAEELAALAGVTLGEVINVSEVVIGGIPFQGVNVAAEAGAGGPGIVPGQLDFTTNVQVTYALDLTGAPAPKVTPTVTETPEATPTVEKTVTGTPEPEASPTAVAPEGTPAPSDGGAIAPNPPVIPHELAGREDCLLCHDPVTGIEPAPKDHVNFTVDQCQTCHKLGVKGPPEPTVAEGMTKDLCLFCHGPFEELQARTVDFRVSERVTVNPHVYVPHESTDPTDIADCDNCHDPHPLPVTDAVEFAQANVRWCVTTCHHTGTFSPCSDCH